MSHPSTSVREQMGSASARGWSGWSVRSPKYHNPLDLLGECVIHPDSPGSHRKCCSSSQAAAESSRMDLAVFSLSVILCEMLQLNWELRHLPENPHVSSAKSGLFLSLQEVGYECFSLKRSGDPYSSFSDWLPDYGWCYFLHEIGDLCSVRHLPSNEGLQRLVSKCTEMSNELLTSNTYALRGVMFQLFLMASPRDIPTRTALCGSPSEAPGSSSHSSQKLRWVPLYYLWNIFVFSSPRVDVCTFKTSSGH